MSDEEEYELRDELRLCPVCRMSISVWATRCRFCGEEVGRPKREEKKLTLRDLGVPKDVSYKQSEEVRKALEAFRKELVNSPTSPGMGHQGNTINNDIDGMPQLDAESKAILESTYAGSAYTSNKPKKKQSRFRFNSSDLLRNAALVLALALGAVILLYALTAGYKVVAGYMAEEPTVDTHPDYNRAFALLEEGESPVVALEEALRALSYHNTPENRAVAGQVRDTLEAEVNVLLEQEPWRKANFDRASALASQAAEIDSDPRIRALYNRVVREIAAYKMVLRAIDEEAETATFILNNPYVDATEETVAVGEYLQDRFLVSKITSREVQLLDSRYETDRGFRRLVCRVLEPVSAP